MYIGNNQRAGAHSDGLAPQDQISITTGYMEGFEKVYRFIK